jgi:hypothetical protein
VPAQDANQCTSELTDALAHAADDFEREFEEYFFFFFFSPPFCRLSIFPTTSCSDLVLRL